MSIQYYGNDVISIAPQEFDRLSDILTTSQRRDGDGQRGALPTRCVYGSGQKSLFQQ